MTRALGMGKEGRWALPSGSRSLNLGSRPCCRRRSLFFDVFPPLCHSHQGTPMNRGRLCNVVLAGLSGWCGCRAAIDCASVTSQLSQPSQPAQPAQSSVAAKISKRLVRLMSSGSSVSRKLYRKPMLATTGRLKSWMSSISSPPVERRFVPSSLYQKRL